MFSARPVRSNEVLLQRQRPGPCGRVFSFSRAREICKTRPRAAGAFHFFPICFTKSLVRFDSGAYTIPYESFISDLPQYNGSGIVGGGHVGYNWQSSYWVVGLEGDFEGSSYSGSGSGAGTAGGLGLLPILPTSAFSNYTTRIPVQGSVRGRIGVAWDRALFYVTGGAEFANIQDTYTSAVGFDSFSSIRAGWTLGAGVEYAIDPNWSIRAEYRYTDFGRYNDFFTNSNPGFFTTLHVTDNAVRVGFSYKFDLAPPPGPVVAKY